MNDLCAVQDVKTALKIDSQSSGSLDSTIETYIEGVTSEFFKAIDRPDGWDPTTYTNEVYNGNGQQFMPLKHDPITAVSLVQIETIVVEFWDQFTGNPPQLPNNAAGGYTFDDKTIYLTGRLRFRRGFQNVRFSYTAGYAVTPPDVVLAAAESVALRISKFEHLDVTSQRGEAGNQTNFRRDTKQDGRQGLWSDSMMQAIERYTVKFRATVT